MAIMVSGAQAIFVNLLKSEMQSLVPQLNANDAIRAGATAFIASVPESLRALMIESYNEAIVATNYLGMALAIGSVVASFGVWNTKVEVKMVEKPTTGEEIRTV